MLVAGLKCIKMESGSPGTANLSLDDPFCRGSLPLRNSRASIWFMSFWVLCVCVIGVLLGFEAEVVIDVFVMSKIIMIALCGENAIFFVSFFV